MHNRPKTRAERELLGQFIAHLRRSGWQSRAQLAGIFRIKTREVRKLAQMAGTDVVRGQLGFNHFDNVPVAVAIQCAETMMSQARVMHAEGTAALLRAKTKAAEPTAVPKQEQLL